MKSLIKRMLQKLAFAAFEPIALELTQEMEASQIRLSQETQILLAHYYRNLVEQERRPLPTFDEVGFRCHSQCEEDGILLYLFSLLGSTSKVAVELGAGCGRECNTTNLIVNHGWHGFLFDGDPANVETGRRFFSQHRDTWIWPPKFIHAWITAENVNQVLLQAGISGEIDLLSLDIDGMDYWVWKALGCVEPRVVVCETHNVIGPEKALTVPYDPDFILQTPDYCGASLAAMVNLGFEKGYRLVGTHRYGFNAFFVRNGIGEDLLPSISIEACLQHPFAQHARTERWPKVKGMQWIEV